MPHYYLLHHLLLLLLLPSGRMSVDIRYVTQHIPALVPTKTSRPSTPLVPSRNLQSVMPIALHLPSGEGCHQLRTSIDWSAQVEASVYSTPILRMSASSGATSIVASTYVHFLEQLDSNTGNVLPGECCSL